MSERIAKYLARCGVGSRREAEEYIRQKRITVNGETVETPAFLVEGTENILFDGEKINKKDKCMINLDLMDHKGLVEAKVDIILMGLDLMVLEDFQTLAILAI